MSRRELAGSILEIRTALPVDWWEPTKSIEFPAAVSSDRACRRRIECTSGSRSHVWESQGVCTSFAKASFKREGHKGHTRLEQLNQSCVETVAVPVSVSAQDGIVALGKAHTRSAPTLSSLAKVALETVPIFAWLNTDRS